MLFHIVFYDPKNFASALMQLVNDLLGLSVSDVFFSDKENTPVRLWGNDSGVNDSAQGRRINNNIAVHLSGGAGKRRCCSEAPPGLAGISLQT